MHSIPSPPDTMCLLTEDLYDMDVTEIQGGVVETDGLPCVVCGETTMQPVFQLASGSWRIVNCVSCGTGRLEPLPTPREIAQFYPPAYYGHSGRKFKRYVEWAVRFVAARHVRFLARHLPKCGRILDVGCGRGTVLSALADQGFEVHGFEVNSHAVDGADSRADIRIASTLVEAAYPSDHFDLVILWHVLEHLPNPRETLSEIHRILRPSGEVVIAVPNYSSWQARYAGHAWFHLDPPRHLYHFGAAGLQGLAERCGFQQTSEHHFSLRQNPFGWVQSWLNRQHGRPRNELYKLLQNRSQTGTGKLTGTRKLGLLSVFALGMPIGLMLEILATIFRSGASVHIVARAVK